MKRITIVFVALVTLVAAGTAVAQGTAVKANVPFDFTVGNAHVPAGTYLVMRAGSTNLVEIRNTSGKPAIFSSVYSDGKRPESGKLVFDKWGDQYFLREILCANADMSLQVPESKTETRIQRQQASVQPNKDEVYVALAEIR